MQVSVERPAPRFLTATWRALAMLNYEVDPAVLMPWVPAGTELDSWSGRTFVSMVGFRFMDTRVYRIAVPFHVSFEEVNLRFYVRRAAADGSRRGVVFVREIVPRRAIAWLARATYAERYVAMPMRHDVVLPSDGDTGRAVYAWRWRGAWQRLGVEVKGVPRLPAAGSEEEFITEHYWGYARRPDGTTIEYRVEHPQWRVWTATSASLACDATALYGPELGAALGGTPSSAFLAEGSAVVVRRGVPLCGPDAGE